MHKPRRARAVVVIALLIGAFLVIKGCNRLPPLGDRSISTAIVDTETTRLGRVIAPLVAAHTPYSGIYGLLDAHDAFAARVRMAEAADRSLDVQYYIWHKDLSGTLLLDALRDAADRGVRVRLLLDDNNTSGLDETLAALDSHPAIEVRLFNPFVIRRPRALGYVTDFPRLNRRMHNKSFTADHQASIVGGRNVGDEYFAATDAVLFTDLDVLAVGPVVRDVSADFDRYWASESAFPLDRLVPKAKPDGLEVLAAEAARLEADPATVAYRDAVAASAFVQEIAEQRLELEWVSTRMISDDPAKALGRAPSQSLLMDRFKAIFGAPKARLDLVSPYFVPGETGVETFRQWAGSGVKVRVMTNSLEATDVAAVHAGYAKRRKALLSAGITLYELRRASGLPGRSGSGSMGSGSGSGGSSGSSLHAKTFGVDGTRAFVGSFNFDPRSARLNTEMGFVIDSSVLAGRIEKAFQERAPLDAYEVRLSDDGELVWIERRDSQEVRHSTEPGTSVWLRAGVWFLSHLPIEWLL